MIKSIIRWSVENSPAINTLLLAVLLIGCVSVAMLRREIFPEFDLEIVLVSVPYPGASPAEVEEGICQKIEEAVRSIAHIKKQTSVAQEGAGFVVIELEANVPDVQKTLSEIRSAVDRIPSFPKLAEDPETKQITLRQPAINVGIIGPEDRSSEAELALRAMAEEVREDLLQLPPPPPENWFGAAIATVFPNPARAAISQANIIGERPYQIDIEISEDTLRRYGLSLVEVANIVRRENLEIPGGSMKTDAQEMLLRGKSKYDTGAEIAKLPLVTTPGGVVLRVGDIATVKDEFSDTTSINEVNGKPAMVLSIDRTASEDVLSITSAVKLYVAAKKMPPGYALTTWGDRSIDVRDRLDLLAENGIIGLVLVFVVLAVFLNIRLAFWVSLGIPVAMFATCAVMLLLGETLNMLTMFAFLMALGILVDDGIVVSENIHSWRMRGADPVTAAVEGTYEVLPSILGSVATTIVSFAPLLFVTGVMGKFIAVMPLCVILMLLFSLVESAFSLPCHLAHDDGLLMKTLGIVLYPFRPIGQLFAWLNVATERAMNWTLANYYVPTMRWMLRNPGIILASAMAILIFSFGFIRSGITPFIVFPKIDSNYIEAKVVFPDGTPLSVTDAATRKIVAAIESVDQKYRQGGDPVVNLVHRSVGSVKGLGSAGPDSTTSGDHVGTVEVELTDTTKRTVECMTLLEEWREAVGAIAGVENLKFDIPNFGPGGTPIEFKLLGQPKNMQNLEAAVEACKEKLRTYAGVFDVTDDSRPGKTELQLKVQENAQALGIASADLHETIRSTYFGEEVMRLQRGRHEVKLMVRYPEEERRSLAGFEEIRLRTSDGSEIPIGQLAEVKVEQGYAEINRIDQLRSITISADVSEGKANAAQIVGELQKTFVPELLEKYPGVRIRWEGQQEQTAESTHSLQIGLAVAMVVMFVLLTFEFRSYFQPFLIMAIIPFGIIGAIWGHALLGLPITLFSLFGLVALTGVVVNDSIVLIDFINSRVREGVPLVDALIESGVRRCRPVMLTSITTIGGVMPLVLETSFQAQLLIPMATALCFGLMMTTALVLFLVPVMYLTYVKLVGAKNIEGHSHGDQHSGGMIERSPSNFSGTTVHDVPVTPAPQLIGRSAEDDPLPATN